MKLRINFKAIVVILFGLFCLYAYFRLINPYLDIGGESKLVSEDIFSRKVVEIEGVRYSYWTNGVENPRKIVVMLPPSTATGDYFGKYAQIFPPDVLIIAPDYPGRGLTDSIESFDTAPLIAGRVAILLKEVVGRRTFVAIGPSFGGMIGTNLVQDKALNVEKVFLVATGEFFAPDQKFMYWLLFRPAKASERLRQEYVDLLTGGNFVTNLQSLSIVDILEQWLTVIDYEIDTSQTHNIPTVIITFGRDGIVQSRSYEKLRKVFPNSSRVELDLEHNPDSFFSPELTEVLKDGI